MQRSTTTSISSQSNTYAKTPKNTLAKKANFALSDDPAPLLLLPKQIRPPLHQRLGVLARQVLHPKATGSAVPRLLRPQGLVATGAIGTILVNDMVPDGIRIGLRKSGDQTVHVDEIPEALLHGRKHSQPVAIADASFGHLCLYQFLSPCNGRLAKLKFFLIQHRDVHATPPTPSDLHWWVI